MPSRRSQPSVLSLFDRLYASFHGADAWREARTALLGGRTKWFHAAVHNRFHTRGPAKLGPAVIDALVKRHGRAAGGVSSDADIAVLLGTSEEPGVGGGDAGKVARSSRLVNIAEGWPGGTGIECYVSRSDADSHHGGGGGGDEDGDAGSSEHGSGADYGSDRGGDGAGSAGRVQGGRVFPRCRAQPGHCNPYWLMSASSILPVLALDARPGHDILDMCASPGGKSFLVLQHLQHLSHHRGQQRQGRDQDGDQDMGRDEGFATGRGRLVCNDVDDRGVELEKNLRHYVPPSMWEVDADGAAVAAVAAAAAAAAAAGVATGVTSAAASAAFLGPELSVTFTDGRDFGHGKASSGSSSASAELGSNSGVNGGGSSPTTTTTTSSSSSGSSSTTTSAASTATTTTRVATGINNNKGGAFDRILIDAPCTTDKHLILSSDAAVARQLPLLHNNMYPPLQVRHTMCSCNSSCSYSQSVYSGYDVHNYLLEQYNTTCLK